jgi:hypothetical protein
MVELLCDQIETTMGHCDLFQWLKKILTPLRLTPITLGLSVRDQIGLCFKSTPLVLSVQWESNSSKTPQKTQFKRYGQGLDEGLKEHFV